MIDFVPQKLPGNLVLMPMVLMQDLSQAIVSNQEGINRLMERGQKMRTVGATAMNATSSRSHSIFTIVVEINDVDEAGKDHIRVGKASKKTGVSPIFYFVFIVVALPKCCTGQRLYGTSHRRFTFTAVGSICEADQKTNH